MIEYLKLLYMATFIIAPILSNKVTEIYGFTLPVGSIFAVIVMYGIIDYINLIKGLTYIRSFLIKALAVKLVVYVVFIPIATSLPSEAGWQGQEIYTDWLVSSMRIMLASELIVLLGQWLLDVEVFQFFSNFSWFSRVVVSDLVSQLFQSTGIILLSFLGKDLPLIKMIVSTYVLRICLSVIKAVVFYPLVIKERG